MSSGPSRPHIPDRVVALIEATPPFDRLDPELRARIFTDLLVEYFEPEEQILAQGSVAHEHLYVVESGCVRLIDGATRHLLDLRAEGDTFGAIGLLTNGPLPYEAVAAEPTVCALMPSARFHTLCQADTQFGDFFAGGLDVQASAVEVTPETSGPWFPFGSRLADLVGRKPVTCSPDTTVREAARLMRAERVGSIVIVQGDQAVGILTDTDLRNKVVAEGESTDAPVERLMSSPVLSLAAKATVFDALMLMSKRRIHHLLVTTEYDPASRLVGVISDQDITHANGQNPAATMKRLEKARSVGELARIRSEADGHLLRLHRQGVQAEDLMEVVTEINDRLTLRLLHLAEESLAKEQDRERSDLRWTWLTLGSKGRREMGLRGDQDNALIYEDPQSPADRERAEQWFQAVAQRANLGLAECGFSLCRGWVMASNAKWRQPLGAWKQIFRNWILEPEPKALMHASVFFDLRALYGDQRLADELKEELCHALQRERGFLAFLTRNALANRPPLSFFRRFVVDHSGEYRNTFDLKLHGLLPIVDLARVLALEGQFLESANTFDRLSHAAERLPDTSELTANAIDALRYLLDLRLGHHLRLLEAGETPNDHIDPQQLSKTQQRVLRAVFSTVEDMQNALSRRYGVHMMQW